MTEKDNENKGLEIMNEINHSNNIDIDKAKVLRRKRRFDVYYEFDEDLFTEGDGAIWDTLQSTYGIVAVHNNYFIDKYNNKISPDELIHATNIVVHRKNNDRIIRCTQSTAFKTQIHHDLMRLMDHLKSTRSVEDKNVYLSFNYTPNVNLCETKIYKALNSVWGKWGLVDIVDNTPIIESMCKTIGYIFTPNRAWRYFAVIESTCSGWGKTGFFTSLCDDRRTDLYLHYIDQVTEVDKYTYTEMYKGKDVCVVDDPGKNIPQLANAINTVISQGRGVVRDMQKDPYTATGLETRIVVTTNVPFRVRQDVMLNNKMICIKTNDVENRSDDEQRCISEVLDKYINQSDRDTRDRFISGCVDLLASDTDWIKSHLGLHTDKGDLGAKIRDVLRVTKENGIYIIPADAKTLEQLVDNNLRDTNQRIDSDKRENAKIAYLIICNELKRVCEDARCKYYGTCVFLTGVQDKKRCRNFKLTDKVKSFIIDALVASDDGDDNDDCAVHTVNEEDVDVFNV